MSLESVVYFLRCGDFVKIGMTKDLDRRVSDIQGAFSCGDTCRKQAPSKGK